MPRNANLMPEGYEPTAAEPVARPTIRPADRAAVVGALRAWLGGTPRPWGEAVLLTQAALKDRGVWVTNDEAEALVVSIEAGWHPSGVPADHTTDAAALEIGGPR